MPELLPWQPLSGRSRLPTFADMTDDIRISTSTLDLDPGGEVFCEVRVRNGGDEVEGYVLEVVGDAARYASVEPASLTVYPHEQEVATVRVAAPRSSALPAGPLAMGVRVIPSQRPGDTVVPEATVQVRSFRDSAASLTPKTSRGRFGSRHALVLENRGNAPLDFELEASDPDEALRLAVRPRQGVVQPGTAAVCRVSARPEQRVWRGAPRLQPFAVAVHVPDAAPLMIEGALLQEPVFNAGFGKAVVVAIAGVALAGAALVGLRHEARSAAVEAVTAPAEAAEKQAEAATVNAAQADKTAVAAQKTADEAAVTAKQAEQDAKDATEGSGEPDPEVTQPVNVDHSFRLEAGAGKTATEELPVEAGKQLRITDVVLQSAGDDMVLTLLRRDEPVLVPMSGADFRIFETHQVTPIVFSADDPLTAELRCVKPVDEGPCTGALYVAGTEIAVPTVS